jgi:hypothetical protein
MSMGRPGKHFPLLKVCPNFTYLAVRDRRHVGSLHMINCWCYHAYLAMTRQMSSIIYQTLKVNFLEMQCISSQIGKIPHNHFFVYVLPAPL